MKNYFLYFITILSFFSLKGQEPASNDRRYISSSVMDSVKNMDSIRIFTWTGRNEFTSRNEFNASNFTLKCIDSITQLVNLESLYIEPEDPWVDIDTIFDMRLIQSLPKLKSIVGYGVSIDRNFQFSDLLKKNITTLHISCLDTIDNSDWFANLYQFENLRDLSVFSKGSIHINDSICKYFKHLKKISFNCAAPVYFPKDLRCLNELKTFKISTSYTDVYHKYMITPEYFPTSLDTLDLGVGIDALPKNIYDLTQLKYLDIPIINNPISPKDFNFSQLKYFSAPESLFGKKKWAEIEQQTTTRRQADPVSTKEIYNKRQ